MYIGLHVKYRIFLSDFNETRIFTADFRKILKYQFSWKSVHWEPSCSMRTDGQKDIHDEANTLFTNLRMHLKDTSWLRHDVDNQADAIEWMEEHKQELVCRLTAERRYLSQVFFTCFVASNWIHITTIVTLVKSWQIFACLKWQCLIQTSPVYIQLSIVMFSRSECPSIQLWSSKQVSSAV